MKFRIDDQTEVVLSDPTIAGVYQKLERQLKILGGYKQPRGAGACSIFEWSKTHLIDANVVSLQELETVPLFLLGHIDPKYKRAIENVKNA